MKIVSNFIIFITLTTITQIGGVIYLIALQIYKSKKLSFKGLTLLFITLYLGATFIIIPQIAPLFGREKIENNKSLQAHTFLTILLNRNYVVPELNTTLKKIGKTIRIKHPNLSLIYLDANFPFVNGFPLLPHLSHNDGRKIDISFIYENSTNELTNKKPSNSGYGIFEEPHNNEVNTTEFCSQKGYWQYDFTKYLTLGHKKHLNFSSAANRYLIQLISKQEKVQKIFIEPHIKTRLNLKSPKIRFHGCKAVRHDDHIHFQIQ